MKCAPTTSEQQRCPSDESLLSYLLAASPALNGPGSRPESHSSGDIGGAAFSAHIATCDRCVAELRIARARLCLAAEVEAPVPAAVAARAASRRDVVAVGRFAVHSWLRQFRDALRLPLLVPVAAGLAIIVVAAIPERGLVASPEESTRNVSLRQKARVTADTATLRVSPDSDASAAAELERGTAVFLLAESGGWYHVELENGTPGWLETRAFE